MAKCNKGIILAAGKGSRLYPMTGFTNKQLLPIYDKPTIYYPLTTLMLAGITDILIICAPKDIESLQTFLGDGSQWNIKLSYKIQHEPRGLAEAFIIGEKFIQNEPVALILGDNLFHGQGLSTIIESVARDVSGAHLFAYTVSDPQRYGIVVLDANGCPIEIEEKPEEPKTKYAVTGLYFYDNKVIEYAKCLKPSKRGELEITDINRMYIEQMNANVHALGRGFVWFDVGTPEAMHVASNYVQILEERQNISIACPEEVAWRMQLIDDNDLRNIIRNTPNCPYNQYLQSLLEQNHIDHQANLTVLRRRKGDR